MSDPHALPDTPKTRRADPLQPDAPARGTDASTAAPERDSADDDESAQRQSQHALENVREGYGAPSADVAAQDEGPVETPAHDGTRTTGGSSYGDFVPEAKRRAERTSPGTVDTPETMRPSAPDSGPVR